MCQGRFGGLLLAVLLAASTLQVGVDAQRTFNKCCAPNEHLYYNTDSGVYECETASQSAERAERVAEGDGDDAVNTTRHDTNSTTHLNGSDVSDVLEVANTTDLHGVDDGAEFGKFVAKLSEVPNGDGDDAVDDVGGINSTKHLNGSAVSDVMEVANTTDLHGDDDDVDAEFDKFLAKLSEVSNDSLTRDDVVAGVMPSCVPDDTDWLFAPSFRLQATPDAVTLRTSQLHELPVDAWCVDRDDEDDMTAVLCPCYDVSPPCVRRCCSRGQTLHPDGECVESTVKSWTPTTQNPNLTYYLLINKVPRDPTCEHHSMETFRRGQLTLLPDGSMKGIDTSSRDATFGLGRYCVENAEVVDAAASNDTDVDGDQLVLFCIEEDKVSNAITVFKGVVTLLGALALLITVVLTSIFPEMRQNIHGKMALCHNVSLLGAFLCIGVSQVTGSTLSQVTCKVLSFVMQYTLLAAFFWLNVMCVEVSWVFSALRPVKKVMAGYVDMKFRWYSLYAWGTTSLISIITMLVEFVPGAKLKPRFGEAQCFFHGDDKIPQLLFLFGPMAILLAINVGLFIFTATRIITHRRQTSILKTNDSNTNNRNKQNLILYVKLFTLMGVTWVFEIVSWAVGGKNYYWLPIDCINLLRGIFIFFIFCCKRSLLDLVRARLGFAGVKDGSQNSGATKSTNDGQEMTDASAAARRTSYAR